MPAWSLEDAKGFRDAAESLKLYRRADLTDQGTPLIDNLYVDPLPHNAILETILRPSTTFVIGRKGTGKSTLFQKLQSELRKTTHQTSAYIDIKTVFESSQVNQELLAKLVKLEGALPPAELETLLLYKEFLRTIIKEIKSELQKRVETSILSRIREKITGSVAELFEGLDGILEEASEDKFVSALGLLNTNVQKKSGFSHETANALKLGANGSPSGPSISGSLERSVKDNETSEHQLNFGEILLRTFDIRDLIGRLKDVLERIGIRNLYVLIDDFSELPEGAMRVVVDVLLGPLNNWSDEFVKFKIAAYPGRIYYGKIDKTKIDEISLDLFTLYGGGDVSRMEESAIDFTRRLVTTRVKHFSDRDPELFFDKNLDELWREIFFASMANPRNLGHLLHFVYESRLINSRTVNIRAIQEAAQRYYHEKIESYFNLGKFLHESFNERSSIFSLKELLEALISRARELRSHDSEVIRKIHGRPPTSHFHVPLQYEPLFQTLELNFFLTKYFEMTDRSARKVTIYALNYGLCVKYDIKFGRPLGEREFRLYFVERFFDYSNIVLAYLAKNQEISCEDCKAKFSQDQLAAIEIFGMLCPSCKAGHVKVQNLSRKYAAELKAIGEELLLPSTELGILQTLHSEKEPMRAAAIAGELDCSYQLIGRRGKHLADKNLVRRFSNEHGTRLFEISNEAEALYFSADESELQID